MILRLSTSAVTRADEHHQADLEQREPRGVEDGTPEQILAATSTHRGSRSQSNSVCEIVQSGEWTLGRIELRAAGERVVEIDDDRQEGETARGSTRFGATNTQPMRGTPSARCSARIGTSMLFRTAPTSVRTPARSVSNNESATTCAKRHRRGDDRRYLPAAFTCSSMSALMRFNASSRLISPAIAWPRRVTVGLNSARL